MPHHPDRRPTRGTGRSLNAGSVDFFMEFVDKSGPSGCWLWLGVLRPDGYGKLNWQGRQNQRAHRVSYSIHVRPLQSGEVLRHSCDNPPCVNPGHLQPGTHRDNMHDKIRRGRDWTGPRVRGERHHYAKLTEAQAREAIGRLAAGETYSSIGRSLGVSHKAISYIAKGKTWAWLTNPALATPEVIASADGSKKTERAKQFEPTTKPDRGCSIEGCPDPHYGRGWCLVHWSRWREHGDPLAFIRAFDDRERNRKCEYPGCGEKHRAKGYCNLHYKRARTHGDPDKVITAQTRRPRANQLWQNGVPVNRDQAA